MKTVISAILMALSPSLWADEDDYVNFIRQIHPHSGLEWDIGIPGEGSQISPTGVSEKGDLFELWSVHSESITQYLLDEQYVTSYTPNATIEIITADPYTAVRRTRCDQPFQVRFTVTGLLEPTDPSYAEAPEAAKIVDYMHAMFGYADGEFAVGASSEGIVVEEGTMNGNATATVTFPVTNLTGPDLTKLSGEEVFSASALADYGVDATVLDSQKLQIWPVATGSLSGFSATGYYEIVPSVTIVLEDLYPSSTTYLRVYAGEPSSNPTGAQAISDSYVVIEDSIPQDRTLVLKDLDKYLNKEGAHTLELLHETPFGTDLLDSQTIQVDRTVEFNGAILAQE